MKRHILLLVVACFHHANSEVMGEGQTQDWSQKYTSDVMRGYNIYLAEPEPFTKTIDPGFQQLIFERDEQNFGYNVFPVSICDVALSTKKISSSDEFSTESSSRASTNAGFSSPYASFSMRTAKTEDKSSSVLKTKQNDIFITSAQCTVMSYKLSMYMPPKPTKNFQNAVDELVARYHHVARGRMFGKKALGIDTVEEKISEKWFEFFDAFGTHYVEEMTTGSRFKGLSILSKETTKRVEESKTSVTESISAEVNFKNIAMAAVGGGAMEAVSAVSKAGKAGQALKGMKALKNLGGMSKQLGQLGPISSQMGDLTGAVQTIAGNKGGKSGEGPANTDDCPPGSQCVETKTGETEESKQATEEMQMELETKVYSYGSRPQKGSDVNDMTLKWAAQSTFYPLPLTYKLASIDTIFDPKRIPQFIDPRQKDTRTTLQQQGIDAGFAQECRDQLVKYCHLQMSYRSDYEEYCAVYARAINGNSVEAKSTPKTPLAGKIKVHLLTTAYSWFEGNDSKVFGYNYGLMRNGMYLLGDNFMRSNSTKIPLLAVSAGGEALKNPVDVKLRDIRYPYNLTNITDYVVYDFVCPEGYQRVGGQLLRSALLKDESVELTNYACVMETYLVPVKEGLVYTAKRIYEKDGMVIDLVKSRYPIKKKKQLTAAMSHLQDLANVFKMNFDSRGRPESKSGLMYRIARKSLESGVYNADYKLIKKKGPVLLRSEMEISTAFWGNKNCTKALFGTKRCAGRCKCCTLGWGNTTDFLLVNLGRVYEIEKVEVSICCQDYHKDREAQTNFTMYNEQLPIAPTVSLSFVDDPYDDFTTLHLLDNTSQPLVYEALQLRGRYISFRKTLNRTVNICGIQIFI